MNLINTPLHLYFQTEDSHLTPGAWQALLGASPLTRKETSTLSLSPGRMFALQQSLPLLPVPPLQHTITLYLNSLKPLLSEHDHQHVQKVDILHIS